MALPLLNQTELVKRLQDAMEYDVSTPVVKNMLLALDTVVLDAMENVERVKIGQLVTLEPKVRKARAARTGRNPATGEDVPIPKRPADVQIRARVNKRLKDSAPSIQKARRKLDTNSRG
jgi:nucleoid DNA-binding protein